jgi:hypothetical protein
MSKKLATKPIGCTEFQLYMGALNLPPGIISPSLIDFTEFKLLRLIKTTFEVERKRALVGLLADYKSGRVAIAWQKGSNPIYVFTTQDA